MGRVFSPPSLRVFSPALNHQCFDAAVKSQIIINRLFTGKTDMTITERKVVSIHYTVADAANADVIDTSDGGEPMVTCMVHKI